MDVDLVALAVGALLAAGIAASLLAGRLRLPGLVLVLVLGMVIGSDGLTLINFHDYELAQGAAVLALGLILYEGGLSSGWAEIKPVFGPSIMLATLGTLLTAGLTAIVALFLIDELTGLEALMLGSTVAATDAAAVFAVLRGSTLRRKIARTLEGESGVNDPIAILLVLGTIEAVNHADFGLLDALWLGVSELAIGAVIGLAVGYLGSVVLRNVTLPSAGLYPVASVAFAALAFGGAQTAHGSGFLAVFLAGLVIGSSSSPARRTVITFHEGLAWVAQLALFLLLGLLVNPEQLLEFILPGTAIAIMTAVIARPLAALLVAYGFSLPERIILGWAGLRGATPIVFATFPVTEQIPHGQTIFNVAFFVVLLSTVLQGLTIEPVARWLGVTSDEAAIPAPLVEPVLLNRLGAETMQFPVRKGDAIEGRPVRELGLPREALLNVIVRGDRAIPPRGSTIIQEDDQLHVLVRQEVALEFRELMRRWRTGPVGPPERPRRQPRSRPSVTTVRPWDAADGDPQRPKLIAGNPVVEQLRTRRDEPGALVALEDGRFGVSGPLMAIGPSGELQAFARRRLANASSPAERAWWQEVVGALAR
ncbi:potassium/proton antiporter (CPA1 family) [Solirubrobacter pauli]|uniref:Potassium/proton antiporter (CPA1 family) n=1 Tax=Solirubrobacter pauli TaxID=166793 RepID=A0A660L030_9ACTN|nr:potassium/proton antiporter [Solirubrobacter pauli]RKQ87297.1 potassium/proton antiporter (CPA1 family) [Solirubrobacter pauli]